MDGTNQSFNDMLKMQKEAKNRVIEMQNRSKFAVESLNAEIDKKRSGQDIINPPGEIKKETDSDPEEEKERLFILALCTLLSYEGADVSLIVALMYLLS